MGHIETDQIYGNFSHDLDIVCLWRGIGFLLSYDLILVVKEMTEPGVISTCDRSNDQEIFDWKLIKYPIIIVEERVKGIKIY